MNTTPARSVYSLCCIALLLCSGSAAAAPLLWTLQDVEFEDGGTATGSFAYDADTDIYSGINITTTGGSLASGAVYQSLLVGGLNDAALLADPGPDLSSSPLLQLIFQNSLTNAGGTVFLFDAFAPPGPSSEGTCLNTSCSSADFVRFLSSGAVVGEPLAVVPLPPAGILLAGALGCLGTFRKRHAA